MAYQILAAYVYAKSAHGNLPLETLGKLELLFQKLHTRGAARRGSPVHRAFEAARIQLVAASRKWYLEGPRALGAFGQPGSVSSADSALAWSKATGRKIEVTPEGMGGPLMPAVDAGRVVEDDLPPPLYEPAPGERDERERPSSSPDESAENGPPSSMAAATATSGPTTTTTSAIDARAIEEGRMGLAAMREAVERQRKAQEAQEEERRRKREEEEARLARAAADQAG